MKKTNLLIEQWYRFDNGFDTGGSFNKEFYFNIKFSENPVPFIESLRGDYAYDTPLTVKGCSRLTNELAKVHVHTFNSTQRFRYIFVSLKGY